MADINAAQLAFFSEVVGLMLEHDGERTAEDREHLASCSERHGNRDAGADSLMAGNDQNRRNDGSQCSIRCHGSTDVHPAQCNHLECTADDNASCHITENKTCERTGDERTMCLQLIEYGSHTRDGGHDENRENL